MKKLLPLLLCLISFSACEKENDKSCEEPGDLVGKWKLTEIRSDPGDGSGRWQSVGFALNIIIQFKQDGSFESTENATPFDRYSVAGNMVSLYNSLDSSGVNMPLSIQELTEESLAYYYGWPWCGGPTGRKFTRL
jgi:hypothetical protein